MFTYYKLDIIPIIFSRFNVKDIVISGKIDNQMFDYVSNYCEQSEGSYVTLDIQDNLSVDLKFNRFASLSNLKNYDVILLNDDPNWYTVYNELNIINETNDEFPLVLICHNKFPNQRRDSYMNPDYIPLEFRNDFSNNLEYGEVSIHDGFFHSLDENTPKNGVLTAIEDFLNENASISVMDIKLGDGITILYYDNSISQIRLGLLSDEIIGYELNYDDIFDVVVENQLLLENIHDLNNFHDKTIDDFNNEIAKKEQVIQDYEGKLSIHEDELNYKNSQILNIDSKLSLKESQIKNIESKLVNREVEIDKLNNLLKLSNVATDSFNELQIQNEQLESELTIVNNELKNKENIISLKDNQILIKQKELEDSDLVLNSIRQQYNNQLAKLDTKEYCINCYKNEISNNHVEIQYLKNSSFFKKLLDPISYIYLFIKSNPEDLRLNFKLYKALKNSNCFDIGFYLNNNKDLLQSNWCKYFSPELHYVCHGFRENRKFNKKYFNRNSKKELLDYILNCN